MNPAIAEDPSPAPAGAVPAGPIPVGPNSAGVWRLRDRASFAELRRSGRRRRSGPLDVVWVSGPATRPPRVAFAVSRRVGPAVVRNRVRRRLRAVAAEMASAGRLAPGDYLVAAAPAAAAASFATLRSGMVTACAGFSGRTQSGRTQ